MIIIIITVTVTAVIILLLLSPVVLHWCIIIAATVVIAGLQTLFRLALPTPPPSVRTIVIPVIQSTVLLFLSVGAQTARAATLYNDIILLCACYIIIIIMYCRVEARRAPSEINE